MLACERCNVTFAACSHVNRKQPENVWSINCGLCVMLCSGGSGCVVSGWTIEQFGALETCGGESLALYLGYFAVLPSLKNNKKDRPRYNLYGIKTQCEARTQTTYFEPISKSTLFHIYIFI